MTHIPFSAAVLSVLLKRLQQPVPLALLQAGCAEQDPAQAPLTRLGHILRHAGLRDAQATLLHWRRFDRRRLPALIAYEDQWWVADAGDDGSIVLSSDTERRQVDAAALADTRVIWLRPRPEAPPESRPSLWQSPATRMILHEMLASKRWLFDILVATVIVNVLAVATSLFAMQVYDRVVPSFSYTTLMALVSGMLLVLLLDLILKLLRARVLEGVAKSVDCRVGQKLFEHLLQLRLDSRPAAVGSLAAQVSALESARGFFSTTMIFTLTDLPFALMFIALIGMIGGPMGWIYLGLLLLGLVVGSLAHWRLRILARHELQCGNERHGLLVDAIRGAENIQASAASWRFAQQWQTLSTLIAGYSTRSKLAIGTSITLAGTLGSLSYVFAIAFGVTLIEAGTLTVGGLIACSILGGRIMAPAGQAVHVLAQWQQVREALQMVDQLLALPSEREGGQTLLLPEQVAPGLTLQALRFAYPESPVMQVQIDRLELRAGERVVLLGGIGSGKSTLLKLAAGLYKPGEGRVRLGHADLWELDPQLVAEQIGYLPQDIHLFKGSLRSNLTLAGGSDSQLLQVGQRLGLDSLTAEHPRGLDLPIGEGGQGLSGGQRQLVGLARLMLAQPTIWLLDEPTSSLDTDTEKRVMAALQASIKADDIVVIATHKPQLMQLATRVLVMRGGRLVADGSPQDIMASARAQSNSRNASHD